MNRGITLIELLLVIAIMAVLSLMSVSFYIRFLTQNSVYNTRDQLVATFRKAQTYSMAGRQNGAWGVRYTSSPNRITLYLAGNPAFDESFPVNGNITITGFTDITFARVTGLPNIDEVITVVISGDNNSKTITINAQGSVGKTD